MLTPAEQQALQAAQLSAAGGVAPVAQSPQTALPIPAPGEVFPSVTTSMPIAAGQSNSRREEIEGDEAKAKRVGADEAADAAVKATQAALMGGASPENASPPTITEAPKAAPTGEGFTGGIQQGSTLPEQKQFNAQAVAAAQKDADDQRAAFMQKQAEQQAAKLKSLLEEAEAAKKERATVESKPLQSGGWGAQLLRALAAGAGAYGAAITHSPNFAQQIMDKQVDMAMDEKKRQLAAIDAKLTRIRVDRDKIDETLDKDFARFVGRMQGQLDRVKSAANVMLARFPEEQLKANELIADKQAKLSAEIAKRAENVGKVTKESGSNTPASMVQVVEPGSKDLRGGQQAQRETVNELVASKSQAELLKEFEGIAKRNPKAWNAYRDATKDMAESQVAQQGPLGGLLRVGQSAGAYPLALDQRLEKLPKGLREDAKRINQIWPIIQTGEARILDPVGVLNEASQEQARKHLNMYTMTPEEAVKLSQQFRGQHEQRANILEASPAMQQAESRAAKLSAPKPDAPATTKPPSKATVATRYAEALKVKKGDPDYEEAQAFIKQARKTLGKRD